MKLMRGKQAQAKRNEKARRPARYWLKPLLAAVTVAGSAAGLTALLNWMKDPEQWPVRSVRVEGRFVHLQRDRLRGVVTPLAEHGFFAAEVGEVRNRLEQLPWVEQAAVRRVWPDRLQVEVIEQQPIAHWGEAGLLNSRAQVFAPEDAAAVPGLPYLAGPDGHQQRVLEMYRTMSAMLQPLELGIERIWLDARRTWRVRLSNGLDVEVGRNDPLERIARFVRVYPAILASGERSMVAVDLRYSNGFAVRWRPVDEPSESTG
jgi:cell division protein FtsQ